MNKIEAISRFKKKCGEIHAMPIYSDEYICHKNNVEKQFQRLAWDLFEDFKFGGELIRIVAKLNDSQFGEPKITVFHSVEYCKQNNIKDGEGVSQFELTSDEYKDLESLYFGNLTPDYIYLRRIKAI